MLVAYGSWCRAVWVPQGRTVGWNIDRFRNYRLDGCGLTVLTSSSATVIITTLIIWFSSWSSPSPIPILIIPKLRQNIFTFSRSSFPFNKREDDIVFFAFILQEPASPKRTNSASRPRHMPGGAITSTDGHFSRMRPSAWTENGCWYAEGGHFVKLRRIEARKGALRNLTGFGEIFQRSLAVPLEWSWFLLQQS